MESINPIILIQEEQEQIRNEINRMEEEHRKKEDKQKILPLELNSIDNKLEQMKKSIENLTEEKKNKELEIIQNERELKLLNEIIKKKNEELILKEEEEQRLKEKEVEKNKNEKLKLTDLKDLSPQEKENIEKVLELEHDTIKTDYKPPNMKRRRKNNAAVSKFSGKPIEKQKQNSSLIYRNDEFNKKTKRIDKREKISGMISSSNQEKLIEQWPFCSIGMLQMKYQGVDRLGTGTLISPYEVLTAAHNVYSETKEYFSDIYFLTCYDGNTFERKVAVERIFIPDDYENNPVKSSEDYAVLELKESLEDFGYFGLYCLPYEELQKKQLHLYGYPHDKIQNQPIGHFEMWGDKGKLEKQRDSQDKIENLLKYKEIFTSPGQSGSAVFFKDGNGYFICGVHNFSIADSSYGIQITEERLIEIKIWAGITSEAKQKSIDLKRMGISIHGIRYLTQFNLSNLNRLDLSRILLGDEAIKFLKFCNFPNLEYLILIKCGIEEEGIRHLIEFNVPNLNYLDLKINKLSPKSIPILAKFKSINLKYLNLSNTNIKNEGMSHLKKFNFPKLNWLILSGNEIGDEGMDYLSKCCFPDLNFLDISFNSIGNEGMKHLLKSSFKKLSSLELENNPISISDKRNFILNLKSKFEQLKDK